MILPGLQFVVDSGALKIDYGGSNLSLRKVRTKTKWHHKKRRGGLYSHICAIQARNTGEYNAIRRRLFYTDIDTAYQKMYLGQKIVSTAYDPAPFHSRQEVAIAGLWGA